ncbi:MAG: DNRLRE domain-containing protein, partial [Clostridiales bacterium]|nr:DNRLRE domain-containing protein [Clostridiales bacterium]
YRRAQNEIMHCEIMTWRTLPKRGLSALLILVSLFVYYIATPVYVMAEESQNAQIIQGYSEANDFSLSPELEYSPLVGELTDERGESRKTFRRIDGLMEAVLYSNPVHFRRDGQWETIDNTLEAVALADGSQGWRNRANDFGVSFAQNFNSDALVTVESGEHSLSWRFVPTSEWSDAALALVQEAARNAGMEESHGDEAPEPPRISAALFQTLPITQALASPLAKEQPTALTDMERDQLLRFPLELESEIEYIDPATGLSVRYVLSGKSLREYITLHERPEAPVAYTVELANTGLTPVTIDGQIFFRDSQGEDVFRISRPIVFDASGEESLALGEVVETADGGYQYIIVPDQAWLQTAQYPVIVDPDISLSFNGLVQDTHISPNYPSTNYGSFDAVKVGGTNLYRALIQAPYINIQLPLRAGDVIIQSTLNLTLHNCNSGQSSHGQELDLYRLKSAWAEDTVTWNNYNTTAGGANVESNVASLAISQIMPLQGSSTIRFTQFDITKLMKQWYDNPNDNHGVMIRFKTESHYTQFHSSEINNANSVRPYFSVVYLNSTGLEGRFSYSSQSAGRAGTGSVNNYSGNLTWTHADASIVNGALPISLAHVHNTNDKDTDIGYGNGWRLNYSQSIEKVTIGGTNYYRLIDGDGTRHYYRYSSTTNNKALYINELNYGSELTVPNSGTEVEIRDKGDNLLIFGTNSNRTLGRLIRIEDANGNTTNIAYHSTANFDTNFM